MTKDDIVEAIVKKTAITKKDASEALATVLEEITKEAIEELKEYGDRAEFLRELALYIKDRNK